MNKNYFLKKKILTTIAAVGLILLKSAIRFTKFVFAKRTILFVTDKKIRSVTFGPISQFCIILAFAWVFNLFNQSLHYNQIINAKSDEINKLQSVNNYFEEEFRDANDKLKKINDYLTSITGSTHKVSEEQKPEFKAPKNIDVEELSSNNRKTLEEIKKTNLMLSDLHSFTRHRIKNIEKAINITGLNLKKPITSTKKISSEKEISFNKNSKLFLGQGGPLVPLDSVEDSFFSSEDQIKKHLEKAEFSSDVDRLTILESLVSVMPLSRPMRNYYVSSGFGTRTDPITGRYAIHQGLDFVGPNHEKVISPSKGRVVLAGAFSDYGNAVVIDHGFGITTRYGHLAAVKVVQGQVVRKGQVIAIQGNTGRSTGSHLHYEIRYRNTPLNPKRFLEAGDNLFNEEKITRYVNS